MKKQPPLIIDLPSMSDKTIFDIHHYLEAMIDAFESNHELQIRRYYDQHPQHKRPARFDGEPF
jgi:hypothetical protein